MSPKPFIMDKTFKGGDFTKTLLPKGDYENCVFEDCNFSEGYLDNQNFMECEFVECNLSNANIAHTQFNVVGFSGCKMMGLKFQNCNTFLMRFHFKDCTLDFSSFHGLGLKNLQFTSCKLGQVDFTESDLTAATFGHCDLKGALFEQTILKRADFSTAYNLDIDPEKNRLELAKFSKENVSGLLKKYKISIV